MPPPDDADNESHSSLAGIEDEVSNVQGQLEAIDEHICEVRDAVKNLPWSLLWTLIGAAFGAWLVSKVIDLLPAIIAWLVALYSGEPGK